MNDDFVKLTVLFPALCRLGQIAETALKNSESNEVTTSKYIDILKSVYDAGVNSVEEENKRLKKELSKYSNLIKCN